VDLIDLLRGIDLFDGLSEAELEEVITICRPGSLQKGDVLIREGEPGDELFIIHQGVVEVLVSGSAEPLIHLSTGQIIGEMSLIDRGVRSATVRAVHEPTMVYAIRYEDFHRLCNSNTRIGYVVLLNIAIDLSFKMRHHNISEGRA
jgi:CRP/FNR family cyclic AMP-dependent transcriptional regulator